MYIVRHGESEGNARDVISGHTNHKLTLTGEEQAKALGKKFKEIKFDKVFSSDLIRARRTAELITLEKNLAIETTEVIRERNYGDLEEKPIAELHKLLDVWSKLSYQERIKQRPAKNGESEEEMIVRFIAFLREIAVAYAGKTILIAAHGSLMRTFLVHLGYTTIQELKKINNTGWYKLESDGVDFQVKDMEGVVIEHES